MLDIFSLAVSLQQDFFFFAKNEALAVARCFSLTDLICRIYMYFFSKITQSANGIPPFFFRAYPVCNWGALDVFSERVIFWSVD